MNQDYQTSETETDETHNSEDESIQRGYSNEDVLKLIAAAKALGAISIDLSQKNLAKLPQELYSLQEIEYLYLEGNLLDSVPDDVFEKLPNLKWLDLRYNQIKVLPITCAKHRFLRTLLLEGNLLTELPPELGLVKTLTGLNLRGNPLEFPPQRILEKGIKEIMRYLRDALTIKDQKLKHTELRIEDLNLEDSTTASSESDSEYGPHRLLDDQDQNQAFMSPSRQSMFSTTSGASDLEFPRPKRKKKKKAKSKTANPVYIDPMEARFMEERRLEKLKKLKEKQALMEQRLKDQKLLEDWRDETKEMQRKHYIRAVRQGKTDFTDPMKFPYDVNGDYLQILSKEERIKKELSDKLERERKTKPGSRQKSDKAKLERDKQLMEKIKQHTQRVQERKNRPKGNPQEQMESCQERPRNCFQILSPFRTFPDTCKIVFW
ncbi:hypothetical protein BSL78_09088 [Apostichopus japonicus]|uniref:Leucine-rich repeat-containing protein 27 n=1 Tax=Stichopus japonicus TaxID=307972 RepID=A0A2G8L160_STIJA|nr:hypothetical protein BSL78_09088 [Apostichopus japonicus]